MSATIINLNDTTPSAPTGTMNGKWQGDSNVNPRNVSVNVPNFGGVNKQTGTSYALQLSDWGKLVSIGNASPVSFSLPSLLASPPNGAEFVCWVENTGAGAVTLASSSSPPETIDGASSLVLTQNQGCALFTDGSNWFTERGIGGSGVSLPLTTIGDLLTYGGSPPALARLGVGSNGQVLTARSSATYGVDYESVLGVIGLVIDGGGSTPATGSKGYLQVPYNCTITGWTLLADQAGLAQVTVKKSTYSGFPTTSSIVAATPPTLNASPPVQKATSTTLSGWTTTLSLGDVLEFNLDSATAVQRIVLELQVTRT